jgi:hypothetical protein
MDDDKFGVAIIFNCCAPYVSGLTEAMMAGIPSVTTDLPGGRSPIPETRIGRRVPLTRSCSTGLLPWRTTPQLLAGTAEMRWSDDG